MGRREELESMVDDDILLMPLIKQVVSIEEKLSEIERLPFYKVNPKNKEQQKMLPAFRIYKELLQQYTNCIKTLACASGVDESDEESPLRAWVKNRSDNSNLVAIRRGEGIKHL